MWVCPEGRDTYNAQNIHHLAKNHPIQTATGWVCSSLRLIQYYGFLFIFETQFHYIAQASHELVTASSCLSQWVPGLLVWATKPGYISSSGLIQNQKPDPWEFTLILASGSARPVTFMPDCPSSRHPTESRALIQKTFYGFVFPFILTCFSTMVGWFWTPGLKQSSRLRSLSARTTGTCYHCALFIVLKID